MTKRFLLSALLLILTGMAFIAGMQWERLGYEDRCLDLGGGIRPGDAPICVVKE